MPGSPNGAPGLALSRARSLCSRPPLPRRIVLKESDHTPGVHPKGAAQPAASPPPSGPGSPLLEALLDLDGLGRLPRTGWLQVGIGTPESIAAHTTGVAFVALALAEREEPPLDPARVIALALVHDAPEALLGDLPRSATELVGPGVKREAESRAARKLLGPLGPMAEELFGEVHAKDSRAARFVSLCDKLHMGLQVLHHRRCGQRGLEGFERGLKTLDCNGFGACHQLRNLLVQALAQVDRTGGSPGA